MDRRYEAVVLAFVALGLAGCVTTARLSSNPVAVAEMRTASASYFTRYAVYYDGFPEQPDLIALDLRGDDFQIAGSKLTLKPFKTGSMEAIKAALDRGKTVVDIANPKTGEIVGHLIHYDDPHLDGLRTYVVSFDEDAGKFTVEQRPYTVAEEGGGGSGGDSGGGGGGGAGGGGAGGGCC